MPSAPLHTLASISHLAKSYTTITLKPWTTVPMFYIRGQLANLFSKGPESKHVRCCRPSSQSRAQERYRQRAQMWAGLCSDRTLSQHWNLNFMSCSCVTQYYSSDVSQPLKDMKTILRLWTAQNKKRRQHIVLCNPVLYAYWSLIHNFPFHFFYWVSLTSSAPSLNEESKKFWHMHTTITQITQIEIWNISRILEGSFLAASRRHPQPLFDLKSASIFPFNRPGLKKWGQWPCST